MNARVQHVINTISREARDRAGELMKKKTDELHEQSHEYATWLLKKSGETRGNPETLGESERQRDQLKKLFREGAFDTRRTTTEEVDQKAAERRDAALAAGIKRAIRDGRISQSDIARARESQRRFLESVKRR